LQLKAEQRIYRTTDGQLVRENDPRGAYLAYGVGDVVADGEAGAYRALIGAAASHEVPGLMHDRLATAIADAQRVLASNPSDAAAQVAVEQLEEATRLVDAERIPQPGPAQPASPAAIVRDVAASGATGGQVLADAPVYRTEDGRLVREGDPDAHELAYGKGDAVADSDKDAYGTLPAGDEAKAAKPAAKSTSRAGTKAAAKPADKAASKPEDK
jgi:hypothetical protein